MQSKDARKFKNSFARLERPLRDIPNDFIQGRFATVVLSLPCFVFLFPEATQVDAVSTAVLLRGMAVALTTSGTKRLH